MNYILKGNQTIHFPEKADNKGVRTILERYSAGVNWEFIYDRTDNTITIGNTEPIACAEVDFSLNINQNGVCIASETYAGVMRGFATMLEKINCINFEEYEIDEGEITEKPVIDFRCIHFCVLPETTYDFLKKCIRTAFISRYTHIIVEFWGMLKMDAFPLLSWPFGFTKKEIKPLFDEIRAFGIEIIPFFQHWGHASLARGGASGKHVVLDQDIRYAYLYGKGTRGWAWDYKREDVKEILRKVRNELIELCGEGKYFHIGCDEAVKLKTKEEAMSVVNHINAVTAELKDQGRTVLMWGDMLLNASFLPDAQMHPTWGRVCYDCNSTAEVANVFLDNLDKDNIIIADWEYDVTEQNWVSSKFFKEKGFRVICCPWSNPNNMKYSIDTVKDNELMGVMKTTWHTLVNNEVSSFVHYGFSAYNGSLNTSYPVRSAMTDRTAEIFRKVYDGENEYKNFGWKQEQIEY